MRPVAEHLRARGWMDRAYVYGFDEAIPGDGYPALKQAYARVEEAFPDLPRACTIGPSHDLPDLVGTVNRWIPQTDRFDEIYTERKQAGDDLWWYISMWPRHPFANLFIDYAAYDHRILFWQTWTHGVTGFLYYCINIWSSNVIGQPSLEREVAGLPDAKDREAVERGARWPEVPWNTFTGPTAINGDGQLLYPGPDGQLLSSVRLECVRHGIEDYELLEMLKAEKHRLESAIDPKVAPMADMAGELLGTVDQMSAGLTEYTDDPHRLLATRRQICELLERTAMQ
jgi:hypothetical protein